MYIRNPGLHEETAVDCSFRLCRRGVVPAASPGEYRPKQKGKGLWPCPAGPEGKGALAFAAQAQMPKWIYLCAII